MNTLEPITMTEASELTACEACIHDYLTRWQGAAKALRTIRDRQLYRSNYPTFDLYVQDRWGFTRQRAYQFLDALEVQMSTNVDIPTESAARELAKVEPEKRDAVAQKAQKRGKVTAKSIKEAATEESSAAQPLNPPHDHDHDHLVDTNKMADPHAVTGISKEQADAAVKAFEAGESTGLDPHPQFFAAQVEDVGSACRADGSLDQLRAFKLALEVELQKTKAAINQKRTE